MDRATRAEGMLRLVMPAEQAAAMVGDQMEASPAMGDVRFWALIGWLLLAFSWRTVLGLVAAPLVAVYCTFWLWALVAAPVMQSHMQSGRMQEITWQMRWEGYLLGVCMILTGQAVFASVRYGLRDDFARVNLLFGFGLTAISCAMWLPHARTICLLLLTALIAFQGAHERRRRALGVAALVFLVNWCVGRVVLALPNHDPVKKWPLMLVMVLVPLVGARMSVLLHRWLLPGEVEIAI